MSALLSQMLGGASKYRFRLSSERNVLDTLHPAVRLAERNQDSERLLTTSWAAVQWNELGKSKIALELKIVEIFLASKG